MQESILFITSLFTKKKKYTARQIYTHAHNIFEKNTFTHKYVCMRIFMYRVHIYIFTHYSTACVSLRFLVRARNVLYSMYLGHHSVNSTGIIERSRGKNLNFTKEERAHTTVDTLASHLLFLFEMESRFH